MCQSFLISDFIILGIDKIHELGGKVNLAYGGQYQQERRYGISAENGGGDRNIFEDKVSADQLARWSTLRLRFFCWLLDHGIFLKLRKKKLSNSQNNNYTNLQLLG